MGCDIHAYIDYDDFETVDGSWYKTCWGNDIGIGRNYDLFACLAGVRNYRGLTPPFSPRGIPDDVSWQVQDAYYIPIDDALAENDDDFVSESQAKGYAECYEGPGEAIRTLRNRRFVIHPDMHTASWLTADELEKVQEQYAKLSYKDDEPHGPHQALQAVIAAMKVLDGDRPGRSRFIFWFDN